MFLLSDIEQTEVYQEGGIRFLIRWLSRQFGKISDRSHSFLMQYSSPLF